jgi:RNA polymerase sigma factor (sigma-70 family)
MRTVTSQLVHYLSTVADRRTDGELLAGFLNHNAEADFAELVRRHGPLVWGTCRRVLPDHSDAEDAFQTVFLVLIQRGNRLIGSATIGPWLHRVAVWTTRNVRRRNARRLARREMVHEQIPISSVNADLSLDLDTALMSLPEKFRSSIVLCHLLGFSRADAAAQLGCAERTLSSWLSRGLAQLRHKLRGLDPVKALSVPAVAVPAALSESVVHAAASLQPSAIAASVLSPTISQLVEGVIRMFWVKKATAVSVAMFTMFAFGVGIGVSTHQLAPAAGGEEKVAVLQAELKALEKLAAQQEKPQPRTTQETKVQPPAQQDLDKQLMALEEQLRKLHADSVIIQEHNDARLQELKARIELIKAQIAALQKQKEKTPESKAPTAAKPKGAYLQLIVGTKDAMWPFQVKEFGADGKAIGSIAFDNAEVLGRYLARTMKDAGGPKELHLIVLAGTSSSNMLSMVEICKAAGFKDIVVASEGKNDAVDLATALAQYNLALVDAQKKAFEQKEKNLLQEEKIQKEGRLRILEKLLKEKEEEIRKLKDQKKQLIPDEKPGTEQQQESLLRELEEILKKNEDELRKLKDKERLNKPVKPPTVERP